MGTSKFLLTALVGMTSFAEAACHLPPLDSRLSCYDAVEFIEVF